MKKLLLILFVLLPLGAMAEILSGSCGENVTYTLDTETGKLSITGTGAMKDYDFSSFAPWSSYCSKIKMLEIEDGVTHIGKYACYNCDYLTSITIPNSVTSIGEDAFYGCM